MNTEALHRHPSSEEWADFLYGELAPPQKALLDQHLNHCAECRAQVGQWRETMATLDAWALPARPARVPAAQRAVRWAAAAVLLLSAGLAVGRLSAPRVNPSELRTELLPILRAELRNEFQADLQAVARAANTQTDRKLDELAQNWAAARQQDQQTTVALYARAEQQRRSDLAWIRRDLETVAVNADERLDTTQRTLGQLASVSESYLNRSDSLTPSKTP